MPETTNLQRCQEVRAAQNHLNRLIYPSFLRNNADLVEWLCDPDNRGTNRFLNSVHNSLHEYGRLTENQVASVRRNMVGEHAVLRDGDIIASNNTPAPDTDGPPASRSLEEVLREAHNQAWLMSPSPTSVQDVPRFQNGEYKVTYNNGTYRFLARTITNTQNDALRGKRVLAFRDGNTWTNFAFITTDHRLKVWQRFTHMVDDLPFRDSLMALLTCLESPTRRMEIYEGVTNRLTRDDGAFFITYMDGILPPVARSLGERPDRPARPTRVLFADRENNTPTEPRQQTRMSEIDSTWIQ